MANYDERMKYLKHVENELKNLIDNKNLSAHAKLKLIDDIVERYKFQLERAHSEGYL